MGLDLGQKRDFTAIAILERVPSAYHLRHLERVNLGASYVAVVDRVCQLLKTPKLDASCTLVLDGTGVGVAVLDLFRARGIFPAAVTITSGHSMYAANGVFRLPKRHLHHHSTVAV